MQIISGRVVFARTVQPAQYESKKAEVELNFVLAEGEELDATIDIVAGHAMDTVLAMVGLKTLEKPKQAAPKPVERREEVALEPDERRETAAPKPVAVITAEQLNQLSTLITVTATDVDKLMEHLGHKGTELHCLPADKFDAALAALRAKRERMEAVGTAKPLEATQTTPQQENAPVTPARRGPGRPKKDNAVQAGGISPEMQAALEADGEKLQAMTGEDHGPHFPEPYIQQSAGDYVAYVERWIKEMGTDAAGMIKRWNNEREMRNSLAESVPASELTRLRSLIGTSSGADRKVAS